MPRRFASHTAWSSPRSPSSRKPSFGLRRIDDESFESLKPQMRATGSDRQTRSSSTSRTACIAIGSWSCCAYDSSCCR